MTKEFKGTKGNWHLGAIGCVVTDTPPLAIDQDELMYYGGYVICESIRTKSDAQLIATAPELLAALKHCVEALKVVSSFGATKPIIERAEKTINKALGK